MFWCEQAYPETLKYWVGIQQGQFYLMGRKCLFSLGWRPFYWWCHDKNALWGRCFTSTSFAPHLFLLGRLKLNVALLLICWAWIREMNTWCLSFFGFLRPDLSPWGYGNRCFLVALCRLIVRRPNLEVATKRLLHQQVKIPR